MIAYNVVGNRFGNRAGSHLAAYIQVGFHFSRILFIIMIIVIVILFPQQTPQPALLTLHNSEQV